MSKTIPWDVIPDNIGSVVPTGTYKLEVDQMSEEQTREKGKYMIKATFRVVEPEAEAGQNIFDNYVIGSDEDPLAEDPKTWGGIAAARYKDIINKAGVQRKNTVEETCMAAKGAMFIADVTQEEDKSEGKYKGQVRNRIKKTYRIGERPVVGATASNGSGQPQPTQAAERPQAAASFRPGVAGR